MKTDIEILILGLTLLRVLTSLRLTENHTISASQQKKLESDIAALYNLACLRADEYATKNVKLGKIFFFLYLTMTRFPFRLRTPQLDRGLMCFVPDSNALWKDVSVYLHSRLTDTGVLDALEEKRPTCYQSLCTTLVVAANPRDANLPKGVKSMERLIKSVFSYAAEKHDMKDEGEHAYLRTRSLCSLYRMIDLVKQMGTKVSKTGKSSILDTDNIAFVLDRPDYSSITALGHIMDVKLAHHLIETTDHRVFDSKYSKS